MNKKDGRNTDAPDGMATFDKIGLDSLPEIKDKSQWELPVLPTRNLVLFPRVTIPLSLSRKSSQELAQEAADQHFPVAVICQLDPAVDKPGPEDLASYGVMSYVMKVLDMPENRHAAIIYGSKKFKVDKFSVSTNPDIPKGTLTAHVTVLEDLGSKSMEFKTLLGLVREAAVQLIKASSEMPDELAEMIDHTDIPNDVINSAATHIPFNCKAKVGMLAKNRLKDRAMLLLEELQWTQREEDLKQELIEKTRRSMDGQQRSVFLQQQMESIRRELYGDEADEADRLAKRADEACLPQTVRPTFDRELEKLRRTNPQSPDYSVSMTYLETLVDLPWTQESEPNKDFSEAQRVLDSNHYGLEKVKDRILEQIAVVMNNPAGHAPILCLVGPPGVGKTSLGQSVATALGRQYQRVSLGGLHDEAEIRGHRRTYIGAMPGRIVDAMRRAGTVNPVLLLDEVDKVGADFKGDPSAALLEVLDPEQNCRFHDNFIDVDYDLSKVLFITTANTLASLSQPLIDRMEVIDISGYLVEEKIQIARRHLLPRLLKEHLLDAKDVIVTDEALAAIIEGYTGESGVRQLEKKLATLVRKAVLRRVSTDDLSPVTIDAKDLKTHLGVAPYHPDRYEGNEFPGVVTGLAWTPAGGQILFIEASLTPSTAPNPAPGLTLTGNLGDVMKESAMIALQYVRSHSEQLGIGAEQLAKSNVVHIHVPEGAIPKDGPSAGITMATAIVSAITGRRLRERVAMTGEITLRGRVLPVGGIKEKLLAARRAGITDVIVSQDNRRDVEDIPLTYRQGLTMHYCTTIQEVLSLALLP